MTPVKDPKTISEKLCQYARDNFVTEGVEFNEHSPLSDAGIDSFALMEMVLFCERSLGVRVPDSYLTCFNLNSVASLSRCVAELAANGHNGSTHPPVK
jgi:acyl carrier protein